MKKFKYFGLSNYPAWEVVYIWSYCKSRGWVLPSVYQGMYNPITREVERELIPALRKLGMSFYAYNPLCGGLLTGKHNFESVESSSGTRFDKSNEMYLTRYWNREVRSFDGIRFFLRLYFSVLWCHWRNSISMWRRRLEFRHYSKDGFSFLS